MRRRTSVCGFVAVWLVVCCVTASGQWQVIVPGIDYQEYTVSGPNEVYVARMDRSNLDCTIDTMLGQGTLTGGTETVPSMAAKHEGAIGYWGQSWGQRYDVVVAVNGDFYSGGVPSSGQISSGWYAKRFTDFTAGSGFAWQLDREAFIGECVRHVASKQQVTYVNTGQTQNFQGINVARASDELILYTHHYAATTPVDSSGAEVVVKMSRPAMILPLPAGAVGTVVEIRSNQGATPIPFDHVVLSAHGSAETKLLANVSVGSEVKISQEIRHYEHDCSTPFGYDWTNTYASIGGSFHFLRNGVIQSSSDPGATQRHPRTAIALNDDYIYFVVVDGRSGVSVGMSMTELGNFCIGYLDAVEGLNQDGGGSSTMWVDGVVKNVPSDGSPRWVANGLMMAVVEPIEISDRFVEGEEFGVVTSTPVRVGPGENYSPVGTISSGTDGVVLDHELNGVLATGDYWWRCNLAGVVGWVPGSAMLEAGCAGDYNGDGQVDGDDALVFLYCFKGPLVTYNTGNICLAGDGDDDLDVDLVDFAVFQRCLVGP